MLKHSIVTVSSKRIWTPIAYRHAVSNRFRVFDIVDDVSVVEFMYFISARMPGQSCHRRLRSFYVRACVVVFLCVQKKTKKKQTKKQKQNLILLQRQIRASTIILAKCIDIV